MKLFYEVICRYFRAPWDIGAREELVSLVERGHIQPCRTIDLGCGTGENTIYLAQQGFDVIGGDYAEAAIEKAWLRARNSGVRATARWWASLYPNKHQTATKITTNTTTVTTNCSAPWLAKNGVCIPVLSPPLAKVTTATLYVFGWTRLFIRDGDEMAGTSVRADAG